jgi:FkbM family methyltransferase
MKLFIRIILNKLPRIASILSILYLYFLIKNKKLTSNEVEFNFLKKIVKKNSNVIDIGANIGRYSFMLQRIISSKNICYSFEPNPRIFFIMNSLIYLLNINNISLLNFAISNKESVVNFKNIFSVKKLYDTRRDWYFDFNTESRIVKSNKFIKVNSTTIDRFFFKNISFIKIDTEGNDYKVLLNCKETIKTSLPNILIEEDSLKIRKFFKSLAYKKVYCEDLKRNHLYCSKNKLNKIEIILKK